MLFQIVFEGSMAYATEQIAKALRAAREGKGVSQRALARLAGVPQSHISKIESGAVDLRLSSLVEIARALDLEVTLVPQKSLSAVQSVIRSGERPAPQGVPGPSPAREIEKLHDALRAALQEHPGIRELAQLQRQVRDLQHLSGAVHDMGALREATRAVRAFKDSTGRLDALRRVLSDLQDLRNRIVHDVPRAGTVKPAYSLAEDDDG
jgi:transcriptional regulator with XRE-family HTH domain